MIDEAVTKTVDEAEVSELSEEQKKAKRRGLAPAAIMLAGQGRWEDALSVNGEILEMFPDDPEASNRVANAYIQLNQIEQALAAYERTVVSQPTNVIAQRNIGKLRDRLARIAEAGETAVAASQKLSPAFFVEEVGKTGIATLGEVEADAALRLTAGEKVTLKVVKGSIQVRLLDGARLGKIDSTLAERLTRLMKTGNKYEAGVVMAEPNRIRILIRETKQSPENEGRISFPPKTAAVRAYTRETLLRRASEDEDDLESDTGDGDGDDGDDEDENPSEFGFSETSLSGDSNAH